jgi:hypothetical protein
MAREAKQEYRYHEDGAIALYRRPNSAMWYARCKLDDGVARTVHVDDEVYAKYLTPYKVFPSREDGFTIADSETGKPTYGTLVEALRRGLDAPVLMISGHGDIPTAVKTVKLSAAGFIEKPVDNDKLLATVETACTAHQQQCRQHGRAINALKGYGQLTRRERQVFWSMIDGLLTKENAATAASTSRTA